MNISKQIKVKSQARQERLRDFQLVVSRYSQC